MGRIRIGVSGWRYTPWRGNFYPKKLAQARELEYASRVFSSIELNGSFYSLQRPFSYAQWAQQTPPGFVFAVKGGSYITHMLRLRNAETAIANFFASGLFELGDKLGPILWQFPPNMAFEPERFEAFFRLLPKTTAAAAVVLGNRRKKASKSSGSKPKLGGNCQRIGPSLSPNSNRPEAKKLATAVCALRSRSMWVM